MSRHAGEQKGRWRLPPQGTRVPQRGQGTDPVGTTLTWLTTAILSTSVEECQPEPPWSRGSARSRPSDAGHACRPSLAQGRSTPGSSDTPVGRLARTSFAVAIAGALLMASLARPPLALPGELALRGVVEELIGARARGATGDVTGRVYEESTRRHGDARNREGIPIALVPWSAAQVADLEVVKAGARRSPQSYRTAGAAIESVYIRYEAELRDAGGADLIHRASTDAKGVFHFARVPAGEWLLLARFEARRDEVAQPRRVPKNAAERFEGNERLHARGTVIYWWRQVDVR